MKSRTRLDSAVFQLTPTRTRYTLVINAKGKTEKVSSGLLKPFLAHLRVAQDQVARGCYSIMLVPSPVNDAVWFTKDTVERFVRFVNAPEVLEWVNMTESEILQIQEAISIQNNDSIGSNNAKNHKIKVDGYREGPRESTKGGLPIHDNAENTVTIYKLGGHCVNSDGSIGLENTKVQFLRVLETRKTVLQKEQGMAFARALAAGFDMDRMVHLISFAECFGALRLREACLGFMVLWRGKHGTDNLFEIEATEVMPHQLELSSVNTYNTMTHENEKCDKVMEASSDSYGKFGTEGSTQCRNAANADVPFDHDKEKRSSVHQEYCHPLQRMPYHHNHLGSAPLLEPLQVEDPRGRKSQPVAINGHPVDGKKENSEADMEEMSIPCTRPQADAELEKQSSQGPEQRRKAGRIGRKKSGVVFIRNINYTSSERRHSRTDGGSQGTFDPENSKEVEDAQDVGPKYKQKKSVGCTKAKEIQSRPNSVYRPETDGGNWHVFQNILLQHNDKDKDAHDRGMLAQDQGVEVKGQQNRIASDSVTPYGHDSYQVLHVQDSLVGTGHADVNEKLYKNLLFIDESFILPPRSSLEDESRIDCIYTNIDSELPLGLQTKENVPSRGRAQLSYEPDDLSLVTMSGKVSESIGYDPSVDCDVKVSARSDVTLQKRNKEDSIDGVTEMSKKSIAVRKSKGINDNAGKRKTGEALKLNPSTEDQAREERIIPLKADLQKMKKTKEEVEIKRLEALKIERQKRITARSSSGPSQVTSTSQMRPQLKPKLSSTLYKGLNSSEVKPMQQLPNGTASLGSSVSQKINKASNVIKPSQSQLSPISYKGSKFSDSEPGLSSPLQRLRRRAASLRSNASQKITRPSGDHNDLTKKIRSASLPVLKKDNAAGKTEMNEPVARVRRLSTSSLPELRKYDAVLIPGMSVSAAQIRRLSDPKLSNRDHVSMAEPKVGTLGIRRQSQSETSNSHQVTSTKSQSPTLQSSSSVAGKDKSTFTVPSVMKDKTLTCPSDVFKSNTKQLTLKRTDSFSVTPEGTEDKTSCTKALHNGNGEDKGVIETTVVLENEIPLIPVNEVSRERIGSRESYSGQKVGEKLGIEVKCTAIHAPASPVSMKEVGGSIERHVDEKQYSPEVVAEEAINSSLEEPNTPSLEKTGRVPPSSSEVETETIKTPRALLSYFTNASLDDPCTPNIEKTRVPPNNSKIATKTPPSNSSEMAIKEFSDSSSLEKTPGGSIRRLPRGIRRILRFGRSSGKNSDESNKGNVVDKCVSSTASSNQGKKLEQRGYSRASMSHALYIV